MKFEVINEHGKTVMYTESINHIPDDKTLESMRKSGYKFKIDGKMANKKMISEILVKKETTNE